MKNLKNNKDTAKCSVENQETLTTFGKILLIYEKYLDINRDKLNKASQTIQIPSRFKVIKNAKCKGKCSD